MKISNETKVGAITAVAIVVLILGFNYLKGRNITDRSDKVFAIFPSVKGVTVSNAVVINGLPVGKVSELKETDPNLSGILVTINITKNINIPTNSVVTINSELLGATSLDIILGDSKTYVRDGDTLQSRLHESVMGQLTKSINPAIDNVNRALVSVDDLIRKTSSIVDTSTQVNIKSIIANLASSSNSLRQLVNEQNGVLTRSLNHVESITGNLATSNERISNTIENFEKTSENLSNADIETTLTNLRNTMTKLEQTVDNINSTNGTMGLLLNDRKLYDEIRQTNRSLTTLLDDVRVNPKRYVSISVFGRKANQQPLMYPIYDSTLR